MAERQIIPWYRRSIWFRLLAWPCGTCSCGAKDWRPLYDGYGRIGIVCGNCYKTA